MSPGSLSFTKLVMMSSAPVKSARDARYASQDPFMQSMLSHTIATPICISNVFILRRMQQEMILLKGGCSNQHTTKIESRKIRAVIMFPCYG